MKYAQIRVLRDLITNQEVWNCLKGKYIRYSEGETADIENNNEEEEEEDGDRSNVNNNNGEINENIAPDEDIIRPFFLAMSHLDFGACRMLMPEENELQTLTKREIDMVVNFIDEKTIHSFSARITFTPEERKVVNEI